MPMTTIRYVTQVSNPELRQQIAALASRLEAETLGKDPAVTVPLVEQAEPESWFIAGKCATEAGLSAFWLPITITEGS